MDKKNILKFSTLYSYGLNSFFLQQLTDENELCRLVKIIVHNKYYLIGINYKNLPLKIINKNHSDKKNTNDVYVGDWVVIDKEINQPYANHIYIKKILKRYNILQRKLNDKMPKSQILACNINFVFLCIPIYEINKLNKIKRLVLAILAAKMEPIILITKIDLLKSVKNYLFHEIKLLYEFPQCKIIYITLNNMSSFDKVRDILANTNLSALMLGVSGAGKSTICNHLMSKEDKLQKTEEIDENSLQGKHTTVSRKIILLPQGGTLVDIPGIREFGFWIDDKTSIAEIFADIILFSKECKFRNCKHISEAHCRVKEALANHELDYGHYQNYLKIYEEYSNLEKQQQYKKYKK